MSEKISFKHRFISALIPLAAWLIWLLTSTLRVRLVDPFRMTRLVEHKPVIYAFWHEHQLTGMSFFRGSGIYVLVSRSRDGDYIAQALKWFGFNTVRASTSTGKVTALRGLARAIRENHHTAITPDGPRGPRQVCQPGPVFLAAMTGAPIVPIGCAVDRSWRLKSWDRFEIPKPFARTVIIFGEPIAVPPELDEAGLAGAVKNLETVMKDLESQARGELGLKEPL